MQQSKRHGEGVGKPFKFHSGWRIMWRDPSGKRKSKTYATSKFGADAYKLALAELTRIKGELQAIRDGTKTFVPDDGLTLGKFYEKHWLPERNARKRQPENDQSLWSVHLKEAFADTPLKRFADPVLVKRFKVTIAGKCNSPATAQRVMSLLMGMLNHAAETGRLGSVPRVKRIKEEKKGFNILKTDKEIDALLGRATCPEHFAVWAVALFTGMRAGEIVALRWRDVDLDAGRIIVRYSHENAPKSGKARSVPVLANLAPVLKTWKELNKETNNPTDNPLGLVFPSPEKDRKGEKGRMYRVDTSIFTKHYHAALIASGIESDKMAKSDRMRFHDLRHTFASMFLSHGGSLQELKEILGHSSLQVTDVYSHFVAGTFRGASGAFALAKPPQPPEPPPDAAKAAQSPPAARPKRPRKPKKAERTLRLVK